MRDKDKIKKIKSVLNKASNKFIPLPEGSVYKFKRKELGYLIEDFLLYASALDRIHMLIYDGKEIWATCPYCELRYSKIVKDNETRKSFWCESCKR